jgi:hypothetical protein
LENLSFFFGSVLPVDPMFTIHFSASVQSFEWLKLWLNVKIETVVLAKTFLNSTFNLKNLLVSIKLENVEKIIFLFVPQSGRFCQNR